MNEVFLDVVDIVVTSRLRVVPNGDGGKSAIGKIISRRYGKIADKTSPVASSIVASVLHWGNLPIVLAARRVVDES